MYSFKWRSCTAGFWKVCGSAVHGICRMIILEGRSMTLLLVCFWQLEHYSYNSRLLNMSYPVHKTQWYPCISLFVLCRMLRLTEGERTFVQTSPCWSVTRCHVHEARCVSDTLPQPQEMLTSCWAKSSIKIWWVLGMLETLTLKLSGLVVPSSLDGWLTFNKGQGQKQITQNYHDLFTSS